MIDLEQFNAYLGDGVYASFDGFQIWLAANNPDNKVIALERDVFARLRQYETQLLILLNGEETTNV